MKLRVEIVKIENKKTKDGRKTFTIYKTVNSAGKLIDVRFTQAANFAPTGRGVVIGDGNVDKQRQYPCVWIKSVDSFEPWVDVADDNNEPVDVSEIF